MQLIGHLRSPHRDKAITCGEDNSLAMQLLNLHRHHAVGNHRSAALGWPLARTPGVLLITAIVLSREEATAAA
jgi:hypothetical protein